MPVVDESVGVNSLFFSLTSQRQKTWPLNLEVSDLVLLHLLLNGSCIEMVDRYKYLGTMIDNKLKFDVNTDTICKKGQQHLYFLRQLNSFNVNKVMLSLFYKSFIESVLTFSFIAWYGDISLRDKNNLSRIVKVAGKLIVYHKYPC